MELSADQIEGLGIALNEATLFEFLINQEFNDDFGTRATERL